MVFVEAEFDKTILLCFSEKLGCPISDSVVFWPMANNHKERKHVYIHLKTEIPDIKIISLEDKDNLEYEKTNVGLNESGFPDSIEGENKFLPRRWRRWELENYLINPKAIANTCFLDEDQIKLNLIQEFSIPWPADFKISERTNTNGSLFDRDEKSIIEWFESTYNISKHDIPNNYPIEEIPDDIVELIKQINEL